jgi:dCMP deaminase
MRPDWDDYWFTLAATVATRATCPRASIGAVLVRDKKIIGTGFNGNPPGEAHCPQTAEHLAIDHCRTSRHAEDNVLRNAMLPAYGGTLYVVGPRTVCPTCADKLRQAGVTDIRHRWSVPTLESVLTEVAAWGRETFPASTDSGKFSHLREEVGELEAEPDRAEEAADVLMILAHIAAAHGYLDRLPEEIAKKLAACRLRTWGPPDADGKIKAIKAIREAVS